MPLIGLNEVEDLLICPLCRSAITLNKNEAHCSNTECPRNDLSNGFPLQGDRWPVLIDFDRSVVKRDSFSQSVGTADELENERQSLVKGVYRWFVRPKNEVAARNVRRLDELLHTPKPLILVIGGGTIGNGLTGLYQEDRFRIVGFDIYPSTEVQFIADAHRVPMADQSVDAVVVQAVLEHVLDPNTVVDEIHRVLKNQGLVYAETPFMQQVHAGRYDFTRFSDSGHRWLFRNFEEIDRGIVAGPGTALLWGVDHLSRSVFRSRSAGRFARLLFFWLRFFDRVSDDSYGVDAASALFFLGRRSETTLDERDILDDYRGAQRS